MSYRIYEPIPGIVIDDKGRTPGTLQVTACPGATAPVGLTVIDGLSVALTLERSAELRASLERAERDVRAGLADGFEADPPEVTR